MDLFWLTDYEYRRVTVRDTQVKWLSVKGARNKDDKVFTLPTLTPLSPARRVQIPMGKTGLGKSGQDWVYQRQNTECLLAMMKCLV